MVSAKLLLIGETGNGKSSLANFILGHKAFSVSSDPRAETKITTGANGINGNEDIFVIDTPGLQDTENSDKEHLVQMVDYIKSNPDLQSIVIVLNYHQPRLAMYIQTMIKLICNIFNDQDFWSHVAIVWSKFYYFLPPEEKEKRGEMVERFMPQILNLIKTTNGNKSIKSLPTFFVDSNFEKQDPFSIEEINRLIAWTHSLNPINVEKVQAADPRIREEIEEEDVRETENMEKNIKHIKKEYFKRNKQIHYDESITYTDWVKFDETNEDIVLPKKLLKTTIEKKNNENKFSNPILKTFTNNGNWVTDLSRGLFGPKKSSYMKKVGEKLITITDYYEREVRYYNDESIEYDEWRKVDTKRNEQTVYC